MLQPYPKAILALSIGQGYFAWTNVTLPIIIFTDCHSVIKVSQGLVFRYIIIITNFATCKYAQSYVFVHLQSYIPV
jgi:hypothetical protein